MTSVERIQAAIEKLEHLKSETTPAPWMVDKWRGCLIVTTPTNDMVADRVYSAEVAELIVTLHGTIDAQLAWLRYAVSLEATVQPPADFRAFALALADAILGSAVIPTIGGGSITHLEAVTG